MPLTGLPHPILYSFRRCPYAMRARMALTVSGTCCELREVSLRDKPQPLLEASPKGTVPVLVLQDGTVLEESITIMRWALEQDDPEQWLERGDAELVARNDGPFKRDLDGYKYNERGSGEALSFREQGYAFLEILDRRLATKGQLCGSRRGFADAAIMPFIRQFAAVDRPWFDMQPLPHLQKWLGGHLGSDLFGRIMVRHDRWQTGQAKVFFPAR
ncbi:glutathione S-transferase [Pseudopontixanthobacter vadosimaris]|uniref:glutathione S-transferase n=1 Tax=Pseudopontixanthobacter vadosimaris TaxID=2726450 RepID=UPI00147358F8